ncbi:MAG: fused MFS/spermidine synthase, partial [Planctomycetota bacterium]|nr:fused MFS/spermidine synthase [Planctomycetota bacterium]
PGVAEAVASIDKRSLYATEHRRLILIVATASGLASMVYQITWTRVLVMSVGSSTYAFTCILAAFILGLALGSLLAARWVDRSSRLLQQLGMTQLAIAMAAVFLGPVYGRLPNVIGSLVAGSDMDFSRILQLEFVLIVAVTIIPTALMGMMFPMATRALVSTSKQAGAATGAVYAANTIGAVMGSLLGGFVLIRSDVLGLQNSILAAAAVNLASAVGLFWAARRSGHFRLIVHACGMVILFLTITSMFRWDHMILTSAPYLGDDFTRKRARQIEYYGEGVDATISIESIKDADDYLGLVVNGKVDASTGLFDMTTQLLLGHLPALLTEDGHKACIIGLGSGVTLGAVAQHPSFEQIDCVEISDESIRAAEFFSPYNHNILNHERANIISADGRNYLLLTDQTYDLIVSEPSNLWIAGMANLFTREFFTICRDRLNARGRMCVWLHGYSMSTDDFKMVIRTVYGVFKFVSLWESLDGDYILIAGNEPFELSARKLQARFEVPAVREDLYRIGHGQLHHVLGTFIACGDDLRDWAGSGPLHIDDMIQLEFSAPYYLYRQGSDSPVSRELLKCQSDLPPEIMDLSEVDESQRILREQIGGIALARRHRIAAKDAWLKDDLPGCLSLLLKAYQHYPGDIRSFRRLEQFRTKIEKQLQTISTSKSSGLQAVLKKLNRLERPTISEHSPRVTYRLHNMSVQLHKAADEAMKNNRWTAAAQHLIELDGIEKLSQDQQVMLIFALLNSQQTDAGRVRLDRMLAEHPDFGQAHYLRAQVALQQKDTAKAILHLEKALKTGFVTPDYLRKNPLLKELLDNTEFQKIFKTHGDQDK